MLCRHCQDDLPSDSPPTVTTCKGYADWKARQLGPTLMVHEALVLDYLARFCRIDVAMRDGLEVVPELD